VKLFALLFLTVFSAATLSAKTIVVNGQKRQTIKHAIAISSDGDSIIVKNGIYYEKEIVINKKLTIIGENSPVIDGLNRYQLFLIHSNNVSLCGFIIRNTGKSSMTDIAGVKIINSSFVTVSDNYFLGTTYGIYIQNAHSCFIRKNEIKGTNSDESGNGNGIHAWKSSELTITDNRIRAHRDGIYFEFVTNSLIENNISENNLRYGLHFMFSHSDEYSNNTFTANGAGVAVMYSKQVNMHNNTFRNNWGESSYGILLKEISDSRINDNLFIKNTIGIYMEGTSRIKTTENNFISNGWAMKIQASCDDNTFSENNFLANAFDVATNGSTMLNLFKHNYWDKYTGYDRNSDGIGDVPYHPVSLYCVITEKIPISMILFRSLLTEVMNEAEEVMPTLTPELLMDLHPAMKIIRQ
jgi:nitrous oxidase accessory protein